ncbi:uncharacterized protein LOC111624984 [Centruroides sculpturatus]|uniref:uncharacterized protein LOC111624984 n=1 Tax=Centruroides sculpturatus TaxID=218467 RepID=UPI000C6ECE2F|nr:uncharacterized protein LOC111624984 [Centruroides sculpturatus]
MGTNNQQTNLKLLQINLQRSKAASTEAMHMVNTHGTDILVVQEPYCYNREIALFGKLNIFKYSDPNDNPLTGIIMVNRNINAHQLTQHTSKYHTTIITKMDTTAIAIISFYCPPSEDITHPLEMLQDTIEQLSGIPVMVAGDFNAKSQVWHSPVEDPRGYKVMEMVNSLDLRSMNTSTLATYSSSTGESWVDICLANRHLIPYGVMCTTLNVQSASDHRYIETILRAVRVDKQLCTRHKTNWKLFQDQIRSNWLYGPIMDMDKTTLEDAIDKLQKLILAAYHNNTKVHTSRQSAPWWNSQLTTKERP